MFAAAFGGHSINGTSSCVVGASPWFECLSAPAVSTASVLLDSQGHIWVAGSTNETDLPVTPNAWKFACGCSLYSGDGYLAEFSADAGSLLYATYFGTSTKSQSDTSGNDTLLSAAMDRSGRIWLAGQTNGADLPTTPNAGQAILRGDADGFLLEYDPGANTFLYGSYYGADAISSITSASLNAAGQVSPGEIVSIFGTNLGPAIPAAAAVAAGGQTIASQLGGVQVFFDGVPAPLLCVSGTQINAIVPFATAGRQETMMVVANAGLNSSSARLGVVSATPAIFVTQETNGNLPVAAALNEDGTINSSSNRADPGSVVSVFATGFGALAPMPRDGAILSAAVPGLQGSVDVFGPGFVNLLYAGPAPGLVAGATQVNFQVPNDVTQTPTMLLFAGGWAAPYFTVWVSGTPH